MITATAQSESMKNILDNSNSIMVMDDFNFKKVQWEKYGTEREEGSWGSRLLDTVIEDVMTQ